MNFIKLLTTGLCSGLLFAHSAMATEALSVKVSNQVHHHVNSRYLSVAVDTSVLLGGEWWTEDQQHIDLKHTDLLNLTRALSPAFLRYGGTDADRVFFNPGLVPTGTQLPSGYTLELNPQRWAEMMQFAKQVNMDVLYTLNAGPGPRKHDGSWDSDNARALIKHAQKRNDPVSVWELGNEINGYPILHGFRVSAEQYGQDLIQAKNLLIELQSPAKLAGPSSAYWPLLGEPFAVLPQSIKTAGQHVDIVSWHYYPQQSERCPLASRPASLTKLLNPEHLESAAHYAQAIRRQSQATTTAEVWLGETGHAQCGGQPGLSDRFVSSLWWLDQLGRLAQEGQKVQIRQSLIGSDYGLLDEKTYQPRPDYWSSLIWKKLMGTGVLKVQSNRPDVNTLQTYAHCNAQGPGFTFLLINLSEKAQDVFIPYDLSQAQIYRLSARHLDDKDMMLNGKTLRYHTHLPEITGEILHQSEQKLAPLSATFIQLKQNWSACNG